tara:strand:- start:210 stop:587 length:378 start_codon:yes stop_codon:yes gene_type:complete
MAATVMQRIRKAGKYLLDKAVEIDDAYSDKIANMYAETNPVVQAAAYLVGGASPSLRKAQPQRDIGPETRGQMLGQQAMEYAVPAANAVPKYVLPAAGVTLAGQALVDATALLGDQQPPTQLDVG